MKLKENIDYSEFLKAIPQCTGEILLITEDGDRLNLKSTLSQFVFIAAIHGQFRFSRATLELTNPDDLEVVKSFVVTEE